jgi:hypothetical protein
VPVLLLVCAGGPHTLPLSRTWTADLRIELVMSLFAGISGGLAGFVWSWLVSAPWIARSGRGLHGDAGSAPLARQVASAILFAFSGAALGFLYWLGWGLISVVNAPWYATGLLFGGLVWAGIALPLIGVLSLRLRGFGGTALVLAVEWLVTCAAVGLSCAQAWQRQI